MPDKAQPTETRKPARQGSQPGGKPSRDSDIDEFDLSSDIMGNNQLHGQNQGSHANQRQAQAGARGETDGLLESFAKLDKDKRAETDLGKQRSKAKD